MRETTTLEFKQQLSKSYLKTVSAYANYGTGKIIFGIADDGTPGRIDRIRKTPAFASNMRLTTRSIQCLVSSCPSKRTPRTSHTNGA